MSNIRVTDKAIDKAGKRRKSLMPADKICLSCSYADVSTERSQLKIFCQKEFFQAGDNCSGYKGAGTKELLIAIKNKIQEAQENYRQRFNQIHPDCINCVQNCCTTPFLARTPFYPEDVIYYMLCDRVVPKVPKGLKHCMFFNQGCTLPTTLRPHVCIEYKCIYQDDIEINLLAEITNQATIYLLAVATRDFSGWRGEYTIEDKPSLKELGAVPGQVYDRFNRAWDINKPISDLLILYGCNL
ncbi:MAG: hypothetical protein HY819_18650 [Acidobacteria bacterium]|nr:hypothetical protein [Acidobacteriota bacterium]